MRRFVSLIASVCLALGLLHGPSMAANALAAQAHVTPHAPGMFHAQHSSHHAHHPEAASGGHHDDAGDHHAGANMLPGCPLANVAAITPLVPVYLRARCGVKLSISIQRPLIPTTIAALDPPPRADA